MKQPKTYMEFCASTGNINYYAVIYLPSGHSYYSGAFKSRSAARRYAISEQAKHDHASNNHMTYNVRI